MVKYSFIMTEDSINITDRETGDTYTIVATHPDFEDVKDFLFEKDLDSAVAIINVKKGLVKWSKGHLEVGYDGLTYMGMDITNSLAERILRMIREGDKGFTKFSNFMVLVMENENKKNRERLMEFVSADNVEITEDGYMIGFKSVRDDYMDKHSGKFRNQVGDEPSEPRHVIDEDDHNTCSRGLHVCSAAYLSGYHVKGKDKLMRVLVDPRDVVAVPFDYYNSKMRVCKYKVVEDITDIAELYLNK